MKKLSALLLAVLAALLLYPAALADDVCVIDLDQTDGAVSTACAYIRLTCGAAGSDTFTVEVRSKAGELVYQRTYSGIAGTFRSDDISLKQAGKSGTYKVTVSTGSSTRTITVSRLLASLSGAEACSVGWPLPGNDRRSMTLIDVRRAEGSTVTAVLNASGSFMVGSACFTVSGGTLTVSLELSSGVKLDRCTVYVAFNEAQAESFGSRSSGCVTGSLNQPIDLQGASVAAVYLMASVSFDPNGMPQAADSTVKGQKALWNRLKEGD